jgi:hypothetical protein
MAPDETPVVVVDQPVVVEVPPGSLGAGLPEPPADTEPLPDEVA